MGFFMINDLKTKLDLVDEKLAKLDESLQKVALLEDIIHVLGDKLKMLYSHMATMTGDKPSAID